MYCLDGSKTGAPKRLMATFDSEEQLLAYVCWATRFERDGTRQFEKGVRWPVAINSTILQPIPDGRGLHGVRPQSVAEFAAIGFVIHDPTTRRERRC
jgi:hypothetical protein